MTNYLTERIFLRRMGLNRWVVVLMALAVSGFTSVDWTDLGVGQIPNQEHFDYGVSLQSRNWSGAGSGTVPVNSSIICRDVGNPTGDICPSSTSSMSEITRENRPFGLLNQDGATISFKITQREVFQSFGNNGFHIAFQSDNSSAGTRTAFDPVFTSGWNAIKIYDGGSINSSSKNQINQSVDTNSTHVYSFVIYFSTQSVDVYRDLAYAGTLLMTPYTYPAGPYLNVTSIGEFDSIGSDWDLDYIQFSENNSLPVSLIGGGCDSPCLFEENFNYNQSLRDNKWFVSPINDGLSSNGSCALFPAGTQEYEISHSFDAQGKRIFTVMYDLQIDTAASTLNSRFNVMANLFDATKVFHGETFEYPVVLSYFNDSLTGKNTISALVRRDQDGGAVLNNVQTLCSGCWNDSVTHKYNLTLYFVSPREGFVDNSTVTFRPYSQYSYVVRVDGVKVAENVLMNKEYSGFEKNFLSGIQFGQAKYSSPNTLAASLCRVKIIEGTDETKNNAEDIIIPYVQNNTNQLEYKFIWIKNVSSGDVRFDCSANPQCCTLDVDGVVKVNDQMCVLGAAGKTLLGNVSNWVLNNTLFFIMIAFIIVLGIPTYVVLRR